MATATFKRGLNLRLNGTDYLLMDRRPGTGGWWGITGDGQTAAITATPKRGASIDTSATGAAHNMQHAAARITRGTVYAYPTPYAGTGYKLHAGPSCPEIEGQPATDGPTPHSTAYDFIYGGSTHTTRAALICRCVYDDTIQPETTPAPREESHGLQMLRAIADAATETAPTAPEPAPVAQEPTPAAPAPVRAAQPRKRAPYAYRGRKTTPDAAPAAPAPEVPAPAVTCDVAIFQEPGAPAPHAALAYT